MGTLGNPCVSLSTELYRDQPHSPSIFPDRSPTSPFLGTVMPGKDGAPTSRYSAIISTKCTSILVTAAKSLLEAGQHVSAECQEKTAGAILPSWTGPNVLAWWVALAQPGLPKLIPSCAESQTSLTGECGQEPSELCSNLAKQRKQCRGGNFQISAALWSQLAISRQRATADKAARSEAGSRECRSDPHCS